MGAGADNCPAGSYDVRMSIRSAADRPRLVLASGSPRRAELLRSVGVEAQIVVTDIDETPLAGEAAQDMVARLATGKAEAGADLVRMLEPAPQSDGQMSQSSDCSVAVLGADTIVEVDGKILGKPVDDEDAASMLSLLSGKTHRVHTGLCVVVASAEGDDRIGVAVSTTRVTMRILSGEDVQWYLATGDHRGKAGGYAIQGFAAPFVTGIDGPYDGVVGLPLQRLDLLLTELGWPLRTFSSVDLGSGAMTDAGVGSTGVGSG